MIDFHRSSGTRVYLGFINPTVKTVREVAIKDTDGNKKKACIERENEENILVRIKHINIVAYYVRLYILHC